jgi:O-antigen/teichoic acid export membrane protein
MQLSSLTGYVNSQMDAIVIAVFLPVRYVGLYGIGMQAASAARSVPLYAFPPLLTLLATTFGTNGREATATEFDRMERKWLPGVFGYGVIAVAAIGFVVPIWLGSRYVLAGLTAAILLLGYIIHVALTGLRTCYVRAIGRPGLETRYSLVWTIGNSAITIPLALLAGMLGVVAATAFTGIIAAFYFVILCRLREHLPVIVPGGRWWVAAAAAIGITVGGELIIVNTNLHGYSAFALSAVPACVALLFFLAVVRRPAVAMR